jgi:hypothetical protein
MLRRLAIRARVLAFLAVAPLLARLRPPALERVLEPRRPRSADARDPAVAAHVEAVLARAGRLAGASCLTRGVTRYYFLRRAGLPVTLCFGLGWLDGEMAGHCWLMQDGEPFLEPRDPRDVFTETYRIPSATAR